MVPSTAQTVQSAILYLYATDGSTDGGSAYQVSSSWSESSLSYANRPALGSSIAALGAVSRSAWKQIDLSSYVPGPGTYSVAISTSSSDGTTYASREGGATQAPHLDLTTGPPDTQKPTTPTGLATTAASSSEVDLSWTASTDDTGVTGYTVYRGGTKLADVTGTNYADTSVQAATAYSYTVAAFDAAGNVSPQSSSASATTPASPPLVDTFERSLSNTWGSGPLGTWSYEVTAGSPFTISVDGHKALAVSPAGVNKGNLFVGSSISGPADAKATFTVTYEPASGTQNHWQVILRHQGPRTYYAAQLLPNGSSSPAEIVIFSAKNGVFTDLADVFLPFSVAANQVYLIEGAVTDGPGGVVNLYAKAWQGGTSAPTSWQATGVDTKADALTSGTVGVRLSMYAGPATSTIDDFTLSRTVDPGPTPTPTPTPTPSPTVTPPPGPVTTVDTFERTATGSWGTGPAGAWASEPTAGAAFGLSVDGHKAVATGKAGDKSNLLVGSSISGAVDVSATFTASVQPATGTSNHLILLLRHQAARTYYAVQLSPNGSSPADLEIFQAKNGVFTDLASVVLPFAAVANQAYVVAASITDDAGGVHISAKAWAAGTTAPGAWQATASDSAADRLASGTVGVRLSLYAGPVTVTVDDFTVTK
jgi:chitodextrinase